MLPEPSFSREYYLQKDCNRDSARCTSNGERVGWGRELSKDLQREKPCSPDPQMGGQHPHASRSQALVGRQASASHRNSLLRAETYVFAAEGRPSLPKWALHPVPLTPLGSVPEGEDGVLVPPTPHFSPGCPRLHHWVGYPGTGPKTIWGQMDSFFPSGSPGSSYI